MDVSPNWMRRLSFWLLLETSTSLQTTARIVAELVRPLAVPGLCVQISFNDQFCRREQPVVPDEAFGTSVRECQNLGDDHATWTGLMIEREPYTMGLRSLAQGFRRGILYPSISDTKCFWPWQQESLWGSLLNSFGD